MIKLVLALALALAATACAPVGFEFRPEGSDQAIAVNNKYQSQFPAPPLQYRLLADESHLILWIDNPTNTSVDLIPDKSTLEDPQGDVHRLRSRVIEPQSSLKMVLPPLASQDASESIDQPPAAIPQPGTPYDNPGFISVPGMGNQAPSPVWQWDDGAEIRLNLLFEQGGHRFNQQFVIRKVRK